MKKSVIIVLLLTMFAGIKSNAQDENRLRLGVELEKEISDKLDLEIIPEIRLQSKNQLEESLIEMGLNFKLHKYVDLSGAYRISYQNEAEKSSHRFALDVIPNYSFNDFKVQYRFRFTNYTDFDIETIDKSNYLRHRLNLEYEIKKLDITPFINTEIFYLTDEKSNNKIRYGGGFEIKLNKNADMELYYLYNKRLDKDKNYTILGAAFKIEI